MHVCGAILARQPVLAFLSLLLSSPTFSHTKSVIIAQETTNTYYVISILTKHDNYRKLSSDIFFCHPVTPREERRGKKFGTVFGVHIKPIEFFFLMAQKTADSDSFVIVFLFFVFCLCV